MVRPPRCEKGVKKGPWTPSEDIMLVTYIQEHGSGNWRTVPMNTGLLRCSKSCRLRWTNYLRPGIKRGNFTSHEAKMIIHLQALLGNRWAAIASYLPQRTDNDIKNYWNTYLKKRLDKSVQADQDPKPATMFSSPKKSSSIESSSISRDQWERSKMQTDTDKANQALLEALSPDKLQGFKLNVKPRTSSTYASSTENIAKWLKGWLQKFPEKKKYINDDDDNDDDKKKKKKIGTSGTSPLPGVFQSFRMYENCDYSSSPSSCVSPEVTGYEQTPFSELEKWLFDDTATTTMLKDYYDIIGEFSPEGDSEIF